MINFNFLVDTLSFDRKETIYNETILISALLILFFLMIYLEVPQQIMGFFKNNPSTKKAFLIPKSLINIGINNQEVIAVITACINIIYENTENNKNININLIKNTETNSVLLKNQITNKEYKMRKFNINVNNHNYKVEVEEIFDDKNDCGSSNTKTLKECIIQERDNILTSPLSGTISDIKVSVGAEIKKGDTLLLLKSLDIKNELKAPYDGVIATIDVKIDDSVSTGDTLITFEQSFINICE